MFFERIIEWDWPDAPARNPIFARRHPTTTRTAAEVPRRPRRRQADGRRPRRHRSRATGSSSSCSPAPGYAPASCCDLAADAVVRIGDAHWLRVPVGKLRNDRYVPLHPDLVELLADWTADQPRPHPPPAPPRRRPPRHPRPAHRRTASSRPRRPRAGVGHVHPHQLRHTLATQAINRGMRLEAIAALLGHRSMEMTLTYARIADRVVADEYAAVSATDRRPLRHRSRRRSPADIETAAMTRLRREAHARMLGNGLCTRPVELDCRMESACETCAYFRTGPEFVPVLLRQRDHARDHDQTRPRRPLRRPPQPNRRNRP